MIEWLGYAASFFVVTSLLMHDMKRLRYVNLIGCLLFVLYGASIQALPVVFMNIAAVIINVYYLVRKR